MHASRRSRTSLLRWATAALLVSGLGLASSAVVQTTLPTTLQDFKQPGTQPGMLVDPIFSSQDCVGCHSSYDEAQEPYERWAASMMGQATRDPIFHAGLAIANQDAAFAGEWCLRCHAPGAWLGGRSTPPDGSALNPNLADHDGVNCHTCHRLVDPVHNPSENPQIDTRILQQVAMVTGVPPTPNNGQYVVDPTDRRRGPFDLGTQFYFHDHAKSPYHRESLLCGTCHDVSNPAYTKQPDGTYALNTLNAQHPTHVKTDEFPIERTYSEWSKSAFAAQPIELANRFGGNKSKYSTCQDCHMQDITGKGCNPVLSPPLRDDMPQHNFNGVNSWVLKAVRSLYSDNDTGLTQQSVDNALQRTQFMQERALDLDTWVNQGELRVRIVNQTGHKLPTGYGEGRRMWIQVQFYDALDALLSESGAYDPATAVLTTAGTRIYETHHGIDAAVAAQTGLAPGPGFHFALNNVVVSDNRIPPRGYTSYGFDAIDAEPVGATYQEEQYWDVTGYAIPPGAVRAEVRVLHQTTTKEYIEFLRDANVTNNAGQVAYAQWVAHGKSAPVVKRSTAVVLASQPVAPPIRYGLAKVTSFGRTPGLAWSGAPSVGGSGFALVVRNANPNQYGTLYASSAQASLPFQGGKLYLANPRYAVANFQLDATGQALLPIPMGAIAPGTQRNYQALFRDGGSPGGWGITNAVHVEYCN